MFRYCFILLLGFSGVLRATYTPEFKAILDQAQNAAYKRNLSKASILLQKSNPKTEADSGLYLYLKGFIYYCAEKADSAIPCYERALTLLIKTQNFQEAATAYNDLGNEYMSQGKQLKAVEAFQSAIKLFDTYSDKTRSAGPLHNIGRIHKLQGDLARAEDYTRRAISKNISGGNNRWLVKNYNQMAGIFSQKGPRDSALKYCDLELQVARKMQNKLEIAAAMQSFGVCYGMLNELKPARKYFDSALVIRLQVNDSVEILNSYGALGELAMIENDLSSAKKYLANALQISRKIKNIGNILSCAEILFEIAAKEKNYKGMYEYYRMQRTLDDSLHNQRLSKQLLEKEYQFNFEKKEAELKAENEKKFIRAEEEKKKQRMILLFVGLGLLAMLVFAVILYGRLKLIRKQNKLIETQKKLVEEKQKQTELQKDVIVAKQKEIVDSIRYAQRIQNALIASDVYIARVLKELNDPGRRRKK